MTSEEKVKERFPEAYSGPLGSATKWGVMSKPYGILLGFGRRESWAWADAWRNVSK